VRIDKKTGAALLLLILSFTFIFIGFKNRQWWYVYKNGKILCLSCIGIE